RDGYLADRVGQLAVLDVETGCATGKIAGYGVEAEAHHLGDVETSWRRFHDLLRRRAPWAEDEVRRRRPDATRAATRRARGGGFAQLPRRVGIEDVRSEDTAFDDREPARREALAVERA